MSPRDKRVTTIASDIPRIPKKFPVLEAEVEYWFERNSRIIEIRQVCQQCPELVLS